MSIVATATPALADVRSDIIGCNNDDAPIPASPYGDGSVIVRPSTAVTRLPKDYRPGEVVPEDPFRRPNTVSLESTYGTAYQWFTFDNGCSGQFVAGAGTALANIGMSLSGTLPSWAHALFDTVLDDDSGLFTALDAPVKATTAAVTGGVWRPWLPVAFLLVAVVVIWRARAGRFAGAVTAASWAIGVLLLSSVLMQYPTQIVGLVDDGVRNGTGLVANGFNDHHDQQQASSSGSPAQAAIDAQMDDIVRSTQYRTWLTGVFGDADKPVAQKYGPRVFRDTHFSWAEYAAYRHDPGGIGQKILTAKQDAFTRDAKQIKDADPVAYQYFQGGKWGQRGVATLVNLVVVCLPCGFLLLAGLSVLLSFVIIRLVVPFAPAAGVLFLIDNTRDMAVGALKRVVGPMVMGPICLVVALLMLRFDSAIFDSSTWFVLKIAFIAVLTVVAWSLTHPAAVLPGARRVGDLMRTLAGSIGAARGARDGLEVGQAPHEDDRSTLAPKPQLESSPGGVYHPAFEARAPSTPRMLEPPEDFVPYVPPPRALGAGAGAAGELEPPKAIAPPSPPQKPVRVKGKLPERGVPGSYGYDEKGRRLPYANSRPDYAAGQVEDVWESSMDANGEVWVPDEEDTLTRINWKPGDPRRNVWDMGHVRGREYQTLADRYLSHQMDKDEFLDEYRDPDNYEVQHWKRNQMHIDEAPRTGAAREETDDDDTDQR